MEKPKKYRKIFLIPQELQDIFSQLKKETLASTDADLFRQAIMFMHDKKHPVYTGLRDAQNKRANRTPEEKAAEDLAISQEKERIKEIQVRQNQLAICLELDGVVADQDGDPNPNGDYCLFDTYYGKIGNKVLKVDDKMPLENLNRDTVKFQYRTLQGDTGPQAKEAILKLIAEQGDEAFNIKSPLGY